MIQGQLVDGRFECRQTTSRPEPGESWVARDGDREVVLRLVSGMARDEADRRTFMKTAQAAMKMNGPTVEKVLHAGFAGDNRPYVVTEKGSGRSLAEELAAGQAFDVNRALGIAIAVAESLAEAARLGTCHGHLSASVVLLAGASRKGKRKSSDYRVKVTGFTPWEAVPSQTVFNRDSAAPEVLGGAVADIRSDCWSLGVILFRMLCGRAPETEGAARPVSPSSVRPDAGIPPEVDLLVLRLMEPDPLKRLIAPDQLVQHMKNLLSGKEKNGDADETTRPEPTAQASDTAENDLDEGISFASGKKVRTTSFAAAAADSTAKIDSPGALQADALNVDVTPLHDDWPSGTERKRTPAPEKAPAPRSGGTPVVLIVVLSGFFVLAAIGTIGWFVLQYQARQIDLENGRRATVPAVVAPAPAPASASVSVTAPAAKSTEPVAQPAPTTVPETASPLPTASTTAPTAPPTPAPVAEGATAAPPAEAVHPDGPLAKPAGEPAKVPVPQPAPTAVKTTRATPAPRTPAPDAAAKVETGASSTAASDKTISAKPAATQKSGTAKSAKKPNWNIAIDEEVVEKVPAGAGSAPTAPKTDKSTKPTLDWGE